MNRHLPGDRPNCWMNLTMLAVTARASARPAPAAIAGCPRRCIYWNAVHYALRGKASLFLGTEEFSLVPGSYVCFPASQSEPHYLANTGTEPFVYLMIGERIEDDEVIYSPGAAFPP